MTRCVFALTMRPFSSRSTIARQLAKLQLRSPFSPIIIERIRQHHALTQQPLSRPVRGDHARIAHQLMEEEAEVEQVRWHVQYRR